MSLQRWPEVEEVYSYNRLLILAISVVACALCLGGCDGEGLGPLLAKIVSSGDNPPNSGGDNSGGGGGGSGGGGGGGGGGSTDTRFTGTWVASYGDDFVTGLANRGAYNYAVRLVLQQDGSALSGTGTMYRVFSQGASASDQVTLRLTGSASGDDATLVMRPNNSGAFLGSPSWYLRLANTRMVGMYTEASTGNALVRAGHTTWSRVATAMIDSAWVGTISDDFAAEGLSRDDRTGAVTLARNADNTLTGQGSFIVQRNGDAAYGQDFNVVRGAVSSSQVGFTFGDLDLASSEMDWFTFFSGNQIVGAYGQFDTAQRLSRSGHATWYRSPDAGPSAVTHVWVSAFEDTVAASGVARSSYLASLTLQAQDGGVVTGRARIRDEGDTTPESLLYTVENSSIVGSRVHVELRHTNGRFVWDLRLAGSVMVGTYQQFASTGRFVSRGAAEWRYSASSNLTGTWAASFYDTYGATDLENTQFALVTISRQETDGALTGVGALRYAGESSRRLFNLTGTAAGEEILWTWRGTDIFGDTVWHLRQAGSLLFGTYTNYNSAGATEATGYAVWSKTTNTAGFSN